jgi:hypothetical protein
LQVHSKFEKVRRLGAGSFATVLLAENVTTQQMYAVKVSVLLQKLRIEGDIGWEVAHAAVSRRFPSTLWCPVPGATRTPRKFGISPSFEGKFLSPPCNPFSPIRNFCNAVRTALN